MRPPSTSNGMLSPANKSKCFPRISLKAKLKSFVKSKQQKFKFSCEKCQKSFLTWWEIRDHWTTTKHKEPEQCRWCERKTFALQSHLCKRHWYLATICPYCGQLFMYQENQVEHVKCHVKSEYRCFLCGRRRQTEELLRSHMYNHFMQEKYGCNVCEKRFKKKKNMEKHLKLVHFICQYCGNTCEDKEELTSHVKTHDDLKCVFCHKVLSEKNRLKYHYQLQHGHQDFYKCPICYQRFPVKGRLLDHIKLKHNGKSNFTCAVCDMPFLYWQRYQNHFERVHAKLGEGQKFMCSTCDFSTDIKYKLQYHVEKTSGIGFFCKKCQLRLECKGRFDKHMQTHEGEFDLWGCDYCNRSYPSDNKLRHHMSNVHRDIVMAQNPRGYPCLAKGCDRYYVVKNSLARHMRIVHPGVAVSSKSQLCSERTAVCKKPLMHHANRKRKKRSLADEFRLKDLENAHDSTNGNFHHMVNLSKTTEVNVYYCESCEKFWFAKEAEFKKHMSNHEKQVWNEKCEECDLILESPEDAVKHYVEGHLKVEFVHETQCI